MAFVQRSLAPGALGAFGARGASGASPKPKSGALILFGLGPQTLAMPMASVESVERPGRFTAIPFAVSWLRGVTSVRGAIVSVVDMGSFSGGDPAGLTPSARLLVTRGGGKTAALLVDRVGRIVEHPGSIQESPTHGTPLAAWCGTSVEVDGRTVPVMDPGQLMGSTQFSAFQVAQTDPALDRVVGPDTDTNTLRDAANTVSGVE